MHYGAGGFLKCSRKIIDPVRQDGWKQPIFAFVNL
jgi:hypothetical protein